MIKREILEHAWLIIEQSDSWTQGTAARDRHGAKVAPDDQDACCWCAIGAVEKAVSDRGGDQTLVFDVIDLLCVSAKELFGTRFLNFVNDRQDHDAMRRLFAHAIANYQPADTDAGPLETEQLLFILGNCLSYIDQLEQTASPYRGPSHAYDCASNFWQQLLALSQVQPSGRKALDSHHAG